jgi:hypothetical protein
VDRDVSDFGADTLPSKLAKLICPTPKLKPFARALAAQRRRPKVDGSG